MSKLVANPKDRFFHDEANICQEMACISRPLVKNV